MNYYKRIIIENDPTVVIQKGIETFIESSLKLFPHRYDPTVVIQKGIETFSPFDSSIRCLNDPTVVIQKGIETLFF